MAKQELPEDDAQQQRGATQEDIQDALTSDVFKEWLDQFPSFEVDGQRLYLPSGDVAQDESELAEEWLRHKGD